MQSAATLDDGLGQPWQTEGVKLLPVFVASAVPGGLVRKATCVQIKEELLRELQETLPIDGVYKVKEIVCSLILILAP